MLFSVCPCVGACACCTFECLYILSVQVWVMSSPHAGCGGLVCVCVLPIAAVRQHLKSCSEPSASIHRSNLAIESLTVFHHFPRNSAIQTNRVWTQMSRRYWCWKKKQNPLDVKVHLKICFSVYAPHQLCLLDIMSV